jgi:hypothetical protein
MPDAYVIEVEGRTVGIVAREPGQDGFKFFSSSNDFNVMDGDHFADPGVAERAARHLVRHGNLPGRSQKD